MAEKKKGLILIDHGSTVPEANQLLADIADILRKKPNCHFDVVEYSHMELSAPTLEEAVIKCVENGVNEVVVHPYFLVPGRHSTTDIPNMVRQVSEKYPNITYKITEPLGLHSNIIDVILERSSSC